MSELIQQLRQCKIDWQKTTDSLYIFEARFDGKFMRLRLNDFPEEHLCTIMVAGHEENIDEFPKAWTLPRHRGEGE